MKRNSKDLLIVTPIIFGIFLVTAITVFLISGLPVAEDPSPLRLSLIAGGIVGALCLPIVLWLVLKPSALEGYSAYALEEIDLDENELTEAVGNWVYSSYKRRVEGELRFLEDDEGNVTCRVTVRKC